MNNTDNDRPRWIPQDGKTVLAFPALVVANILGMTNHTLCSRMRRGIFPQPELSHGLRRYYSARQVETIKGICEQEKKALEGYRSVSQLADELEIYECALYWHFKHGSIPAPKRSGQRLVWSPEQVEEIKRYYADLRQARLDMVQLAPGLKKLGACQKELEWLKNPLNAAFIPTPDKIIGKSNQARWYKEQTLKTALRRIRRERKNRRLE
jgi:DNA-binding transcriptional MerR regulator